ncbi:MAG: NAD-dependent protein deacylase [Candidatus Thorarchaeota archaeon]
MNPTDYEKAVRILKDSKYVIALTGAGVSRESNVPTFRGKDGLWRNYDAMELATPEAFARNSQLVWEWYTWRQGLIKECNPNPAHETLAEFEQTGLLKCLITQNVDGLHRRAGSENVLEVHGNLWALKCTSCNHRERLTSPAVGIPICSECGSYMRPDVVWFGEQLDTIVMNDVYTELEKADTILVIGTSALIQPAASFPLVVRQKGGHVIEMNVEETPLTSYSAVHLSGKAGIVLPHLRSLLL